MLLSIPRTLLLLVLLAITVVAPADAQMPGGESDYKIPPAIVGARGRVYVGTQYGTILVATSTPDGISITDSLVRGTRLPSELGAIWFLSMPNVATQPDLVVGLVSYDDAGTDRYGILRTTDFGASWSLIKPAALADPMFEPTNDFWASTTLREMTWLDDAQHGWIFGPKGIVATSDGGVTWSMRYGEGKDSANHVQALAFRDPMNGVAAIGWTPEERYRLTTDGGATWFFRSGQLGLNRVNHIDWIGGEYRSLVFDRSALSDRGKVTTLIYRSTDLGESWAVRQVGNILIEQTYMSRILWKDDQSGVMVLRSGLLLGTTNAGANWAIVQHADSVDYPMPIGRDDETGARVGFGYASIILDDRYIVQASTLSSDGTLYRLMQWDLKTSGVDAEDEARVVFATLAPTPSSGIARLSLPSAVVRGASARIVDARGIVRERIAIEGGSTAVALDASTLEPGVYRVVVDADGRRIVAPLVIAP